MKRSPMPPRKAPLKGSSLSRKARAPISRKPLLAKPRPVTPEEREARRLVAERSQGRCEIGFWCSGGAAAVDWSHRVARSQGGLWDAANGLAACRRDHEFCHAYPIKARIHGGWILRSTDDFRTYPVHHPVHGWVVLDSAGGVKPTLERPDAA